MGYNWNILEIIKKLIHEINKYDESNLSLEEITYINANIILYKEMLCDYFNIIHLPNFMKKDDFIDQACFISDNVLTNYQRFILRSIFPFVSNSYYEFDIRDDSFLKAKITLQKQKQLIIDNLCFNELSKIKANELFDKKNKKLLITKLRDKSRAYIFFNNDFYISSFNNESVFGFAVLCHEIGHFFEFHANNKKMDKMIALYNNSRLYNYTEISSIFYEMLSYLVLSKKEIISTDDLNVGLKTIKDCNLQNPTDWLIIDEIKKTKDVSSDEKRKILKEYSDLYEITTYGFSYIIAANIFEQYLINEKDALDNLNYLTNNITGDNEKEVLNKCGISYKDTDLFERHIKRMNS